MGKIIVNLCGLREDNGYITWNGYTRIGDDLR